MLLQISRGSIINDVGGFEDYISSFRKDKGTLFIFVQAKRSFHLVRDEKVTIVKWEMVQKKVFVINDPGIIVVMICTSEGADVHDEWVMV